MVHNLRGRQTVLAEALSTSTMDAIWRGDYKTNRHDFLNDFEKTKYLQSKEERLLPRVSVSTRAL